MSNDKETSDVYSIVKFPLGQDELLYSNLVN